MSELIGSLCVPYSFTQSGKTLTEPADPSKPKRTASIGPHNGSREELSNGPMINLDKYDWPAKYFAEHH